MKSKLFIFLLLISIKITAQSPKADFDFVVQYNCGWAFLGLQNKSINADSCFWDYYGSGNYTFLNNPNPPIGNLGIDGDFKISLIAGMNGKYDTITKVFKLKQTRADFDFKYNDSLGFAPLLVEFRNNSQQANGDTLSFKWDFGDGDTSVLTSPSHVYSKPRTYFPKLTAITQSGCKLRASLDIVVKDTAQRNEFNFITSDCHDNEIPPCGYDKHFLIDNDTLRIFGFYGGNCCTHKTATINSSGDTIVIRTFQIGPQCSCSCGFCFSINVPNITKDSVLVLFDGNLNKAKKQTSIKNTLIDYSFDVYPNPIINEFTLSCNRLTNKSRIEILDMFGRVMYSQSKSLFDKMIIHCNDLKSGVYILKLSIDDNSRTKRIIINNAR